MNKVEVRSSTTHGNGVFATQHIKKGDRISQYPKDLHIFRSGDQHRVYGRSPEYVQSITDRMNIAAIMDYAKELEDGSFLFGDPQNYKPESCAHIINDAVYVDKINRQPSDKELGKETVNFFVRSGRINCLLEADDHSCWAVATKDIQPGEEVLTTYGYAYWTDIDLKKITIHLILYRSSLTVASKQWVDKLVLNFRPSAAGVEA